MEKKFHCMIGDDPCIYNPKNPDLGWAEHRFETMEEAAEYIHNFLGDYSPGKEYFLEPGRTYRLYDNVYRILRMGVDFSGAKRQPSDKEEELLMAHIRMLFEGRMSRFEWRTANFNSIRSWVKVLRKYRLLKKKSEKKSEAYWFSESMDF